MLFRFFGSAVRCLLSSNLRMFLTKLDKLSLLMLAVVFARGTTLSAQTPTPVPVLTWRYDLTHAGQNTNETLLTPENVNPNSFGKLFTLAVDSTVYAQPLYVPALKMSDGQVHNVLFVATENDSVYAFDADSNGGENANPIWHVSLLDSGHGAGAGATAVPWQDTGSPDIAPTVGITGTPTINPTTNTMYLVANTKENGTYFSRLHAINIITGAEQPNSPVAVTATVAGTGNGSSGGQLAFSPLWQNQRTALDYYNGYVYFGYAAHGDNGPWHGWLFAYDAATLKQSAVLCLSPTGTGAGLWAAGAGLPIDEDAAGGRMFVVTGNGTRTSPPFNANSDYGESVVALKLANGGLTPIDEFTSFNYQTLNNHDWDQGSGGLLMVPDNNGPNPHMLITAGKEGRILVLNRDNLGGYIGPNASSNTNALQDISNVIPQSQGFWSTAAYWNGNVYFWAEKNYPMLFKLADGVLDGEPESKSPIYSDFPSPSFSISSNGTQEGIAWAVRSDQFHSGPAVLYAWEANDLSKTIYESDTNAQRDTAGIANKFSVPVVTNGKVYVATEGEVDVYGLLNGEPTAAAPVISPNGGTFGSSQNVQLSTTTASASIYYTLDGSTPTPSSTLYTAPITIDTDTTLKAFASAPGYIQSGISSATFTFSDQTPPIVASPPGGTYIKAQSVTLTDTDTNAKIYYTTDGSTPTSASNLYTGPIQVAVSETIKAIAIDPALRNSNIDIEAYVIQNGGTSINFANGFSSTAGLTLNGSAVANNDTRLQLTNGGLYQAGSVFWNAPIGVQAFTTTFQFQLSNAQGNGFTFTIQNMGPTALGGNSAGLGYQDIQKSVAIKFNFYDYQNEGSDSTGLYTNGQPPVSPSVDISQSGILVGSGDGIQAEITYDGTTLTLNLSDLVTKATFTHSWAIDIPTTVGSNTAYVGFTGGTGGLSSSQKIISWTYNTQSVPPSFSPTPGTYNTAVNVSLNSATTDAVIYYTTDGSKPDAASTQYTAPIPVAVSETITAIAISKTFGSSDPASGQYTIQGSQSGATFSINATQMAAVSPGSTATATVTITPANGFTGTVLLKCAVSGGPSGATDVPNCMVTQPPVISGTQPVTATLTASTKGTTTAGTYTVTVTGSSETVSATTSTVVTVTGSTAAPLFALSGAPINIASLGTNGSSVISVSPSGGFTGTVALSCAVSGGPSGAVNVPACSIAKSVLITGAQPATSTLTVSTQAGTTPGTYITTVTGTSATLTETTTITTTVGSSSATPAFSLMATPISISSTGASETSTITITPTGGFTGNVTIACALTRSPQGAVNPPTCSVSQPPPISGTQAVTATLTVSTGAATTSMLHNLSLGGGGTLAVLFFICLPIRKHKWPALICIVLLAITVGAVAGCGGNTKLTSTDPTPTQQTTAGSYTITVTGSSGTQQSTTTVTVTVQ
jgi:Chitobiase/beta-hexosaminidase C-terminal domain/Legume lectin domain